MKFIRELIPTKTQYKNWSIPSKMGYIGAVVGILSLILTIILLLVTHIFQERITRELLDGKWNEEKAKKMVIKKLEQYGGKQEYGYTQVNDSGKLIHAFYNFYNIKYPNLESIVGVFYSKPEFVDCHGCAPKLSFFEFLKREEGWVLENTYINSLHIGSWGEPPVDIKILPIGNDIFGIVSQHGFTQHGHHLNYLTVYTYLSDSLTQIFHADTYHSNFGTGDPLYTMSSRLKFVKEGNYFYDIEFTQIDSSETEEIDRITNLYKFNGIEYVKDDVIN